MYFEEMYDILLDEIGVSDEALQLAFYLKGKTIRTAKEILLYYTGCNDFKEYLNRRES